MSDHLVRPVPFPAGVPQVCRHPEVPDDLYDAYIEAWRFYGDICRTAYDGNRQLTMGPAARRACICRYQLHTTDVVLPKRHGCPTRVSVIVGSFFTIAEDCPHHGIAATWLLVYNPTPDNYLELRQQEYARLYLNEIVLDEQERHGD